MKTEEKIILDTSPEAASIKTLTGWVSSTGRFWGGDERAARYCGSTHRTCECGALVEKMGYCEPCHTTKALAKFAAKECRAWDGVSMIYSNSNHMYFRDLNEVLEECYDQNLNIVDLQLILCEPTFAREIDVGDHFCDDLPEDGELPLVLQDAFDVLNRAIRNCDTPLSWTPGEFALDLAGVVVDDEIGVG